MTRIFKKRLSEIGKRLDTAAGQVADALKRSKKGVYRAVAHLEHDLADSKSTLGAVRETLDGIVKQGKGYHEDVQSRGGYRQVASKNAEEALDRIDEFVDRLAGRLDNYAERVKGLLEDTFYTEGQVDNTKVESFLKKKKESVRIYGQKFMGKLSQAVGDARATIVKDYRANFPTSEELSTGKYAGVGGVYEGFLTRDDCEGCLAFYGYAERTIPSGRPYRKQILADIKASASENLAEIKAFYQNASAEDSKASLKLKLAEQFLKVRRN